MSVTSPAQDRHDAINARHAQEVNAYQRSRKVLGRAVHPSAVHPNAVQRLHELFPKATITVEHTVYRVPLAADTPLKLDGPRDREQHATRVWIDLEGDWEPNCGKPRPSSAIFADATCHPDDRFDRRKGIELAFKRALDMARRNYRAARQAEAYRALTTQPNH